MIPGSVTENLFKAFDEIKVHYIGTPYIEGEVLPLDSEDFEFSAVVDILPEIKLNGAFVGEVVVIILP